MNNFLKISFLLSFICFLFSAQAQSKLDADNGFKDFTFDDTVDTWSKNLVLIGAMSKGDTLYRYEGKCCRSAYGFEYPEIRLTFDSQRKLTVINLMTAPYQVNPDSPERTKMLTNLIQQFGAPEEPDPFDDGIFWIATDVMMSLDQVAVGDKNMCSINVRRM